MNPPRKVVTATEAKNRLGQVIEHAIKGGEAWIERVGNPIAVFVSDTLYFKISERTRFPNKIQTISATVLKNRLGVAFEKVLADGELLVERVGRPVAVILSTEAYSKYTGRRAPAPGSAEDEVVSPSRGTRGKRRG